MAELIAQTESLCPSCLRRIPARKVAEDGAVYLEKSCPEDGDWGRVLLWKDSPRPYADWSRYSGKTAKGPSKRLAGRDKGCPYDCGICPEHKQDTCTAIIEVTDRCNIHCPVCFADSQQYSSGGEPDLGTIEHMYQTLLDCGGPYPVQLSGGEPTLRDDLPDIVALGRRMGFDFIQINTNGIRLAKDDAYARKVKDSGASVIYLQFDGVSDDVYRHIRGAGLLQLKLQAVERCAELKMGVILVATLVKRVNDDQIGDIIQFAKKWIPTVKGVHFQPMTYLGRYPTSPHNEDRLLISDVIRSIETQTQGEVKVENLVPPG